MIHITQRREPPKQRIDIPNVLTETENVHITTFVCQTKQRLWHVSITSDRKPQQANLVFGEELKTSYFNIKRTWIQSHIVKSSQWFVFPSVKNAVTQYNAIHVICWNR